MMKALSKSFTHANILLVDDEIANLVLLERILGNHGFEAVNFVDDPRDAIEHLSRYKVDLIITDYRMPYLTGLELMALLREKLALVELPILLATSELNSDLEKLALERGVTDFLTKPYSSVQVKTRVENVLKSYFLSSELQNQTDHFETEIRKRTKALKQAHLEALERLALAAEYRDYMTGKHTHHVGMLSARIAHELGLKTQEVDLIRKAAPLHDIGKIGIPDKILLKPGKLDPQEYATMKTHVQLGLKLLSPNTSSLVRMAKLIALTHHERWDGSGYPRGLIGDDIPLVGQIVAVADVYDALISKRPYKHAWKVTEAIEEIKQRKDSWFAPKVVNAFLRVAEQPLLPSSDPNDIGQHLQN